MARTNIAVTFALLLCIWMLSCHIEEHVAGRAKPGNGLDASRLVKTLIFMKWPSYTSWTWPARSRRSSLKIQLLRMGNTVLTWHVRRLCFTNFGQRGTAERSRGDSFSTMIRPGSPFTVSTLGAAEQDCQNSSVVSACSLVPRRESEGQPDNAATFDEIQVGNQVRDDEQNKRSQEIDRVNVLDGGELKTEAITWNRQIAYESKCYPRRGAGTRIFVIDTGCRASHEQLRGRVQTLASPGSPYKNGNDDHGHGTHVAATIAGRDFGVAKSAKVTCIKALSNTNSGSSKDVVAAINHVIFLKEKEYRNPTERPEAFLMSISLGVKAPKSYSALDRAVGRAARAGIVPIIAAGNMAGDACTFTPARAPGAITVGALAGQKKLASFSNRGKCVAMVAPGVSIRSAYHNADWSYARSSGTSMAAPHISGIAALILGERPGLRPRDVLREMQRDTRTIDGISVAKVHQVCGLVDRTSYRQRLHAKIRRLVHIVIS